MILRDPRRLIPFLLGIAAVVMYFNTLDYAEVFAAAPSMADASMQIFAGNKCVVC